MANKFVRSICTICNDPKGFPHGEEYHPLVCGNVRCLDEARRRNSRRIGRDEARPAWRGLCPECGVDFKAFEYTLHQVHTCP